MTATDTDLVVEADAYAPTQAGAHRAADAPASPEERCPHDRTPTHCEHCRYPDGDEAPVNHGSGLESISPAPAEPDTPDKRAGRRGRTAPDADAGAST